MKQAYSGKSLLDKFCQFHLKNVHFSLRGHRDQITEIRFLDVQSPAAASTSTATSPGFLITSSKDTFLKLWDLSAQHCVQTIVAHRSEVWTFDIDPEQRFVFTGSSEGEMKIWRLDHEAMATGLHETESGEVRSMISPPATVRLNFKQGDQDDIFRCDSPTLIKT